jgi:ubiquinone/menaquinone biosynthesis C-methylase UbiE
MKWRHVDRSLNFGRHLIRRFLLKSLPFDSVLDIGAGSGTDLAVAEAINPDAKMHAIEVRPERARALEGKGISTSLLDIEKQSLPFENQSARILHAPQPRGARARPHMRLQYSPDCGRTSA